MDGNLLREQYILFLSEKCKISNPSYVGKESKKTKLRDLVGEEMKRVYANFE